MGGHQIDVDTDVTPESYSTSVGQEGRFGRGGSHTGQGYSHGSEWNHRVGLRTLGRKGGAREGGLVGLGFKTVENETRGVEG